ncbi:MAG: hypothetical protein PHE43_04165 [Candidatus Nanoarchaeia archaeon]|nr:hypothetical protein [Candidatus Nanoarchaeia archaeon]
MRKIIPILVFILLTSFVFADDIDITYTIDNPKVIPGEEVLVRVDIINNADENNFLVIPHEFSSKPFDDVFEYIRAYPEKINVGDGDSKRVDIIARISNDTIPGITYPFSLKIKSLKNLELKGTEEVQVKVYEPEKIVSINTDFPDEIIAKRNFKFNLELEPNVNLVLEDVRIELGGNLFEEKDFDANLMYKNPLEKEIILDINPNTPKGIYTVEIKAYYKGNLRGFYSKLVEVVQNPYVKEDTFRESGFLYDKTNFIKINEGNVEEQEGFYYEADWFTKIFTIYSIKPTEKDSKGYSWEFGLEPGEKYEVEVKTDYRGACITILVLILLGVLGIYFFGKKVAIRKEIFRVRNEGGISELKVLLHIKNRGPDLKDVEILDYLPRLLKPIRGDYATLAPERIQKGNVGIKINWRLDKLRKHEERIITYRVEPAFKVVGRLVLPEAAVTYKFRNKHIKVKSKKITYS